MRSLLTFMLAAAMLPSLSQAHVNICGRVPQVRDAIMRQLWTEDDCAAVDSAALALVIELRFGNLDQITTLRAGDFDDLTNLESLSLYDNQLTALPDGVFDGLTSLQWPGLENNYLVGLTRNDPLFAGLPNEVELRLDGQTAAPGPPTQPEPPTTPEQSEEPETPSNDLAAKVAALETRMAAFEASNAMLQDIANRISALEQREPEVITSTRFIPVPVERE